MVELKLYMCVVYCYNVLYYSQEEWWHWFQLAKR